MTVQRGPTEEQRKCEHEWKPLPDRRFEGCDKCNLGRFSSDWIEWMKGPRKAVEGDL
jgi:hypothetical protein